MKRKLVCAMLIGCCVLGLGACGSSEEEQAAKYYEDELGLDKDDAKELADAFYGNKEDKDASESTEEAAPVEIAATEEIISADKFSNKVQIGSTVYEFPLTVGELLESGELIIDAPKKSVRINENTTLKPAEIVYFPLYGNGVEIWLYAKNNSDEITEMKNCIVESPSFMLDMFGSDISNVVFGGGLRLGMSGDEFLEQYGEPDNQGTNWDRGEDCYIYYGDVYENSNGKDSATGYSYAVTVNMNTNCVSKITYNMGNKNRELEKCVEMDSRKNKLYQFYLPGDLKDENDTDIYYSGRMLVEAEGKDYFIYNNVDLNEHSFSELTEEELKNSISNMVYYKQNDDGTAFVITDETRDGMCWYIGRYYTDKYSLDFNMRLEKVAEGDTDPYPESLKQEMFDILLEIFNKGVTVK